MDSATGSPAAEMMDVGEADGGTAPGALAAVMEGGDGPDGQETLDELLTEMRDLPKLLASEERHAEEKQLLLERIVELKLQIKKLQDELQRVKQDADKEVVEFFERGALMVKKHIQDQNEHSKWLRDLHRESAKDTKAKDQLYQQQIFRLKQTRNAMEVAEKKFLEKKGRGRPSNDPDTKNVQLQQKLNTSMQKVIASDLQVQGLKQQLQKEQEKTRESENEREKERRERIKWKTTAETALSRVSMLEEEKEEWERKRKKRQEEKKAPQDPAALKSKGVEHMRSGMNYANRQY